MDTKFETPIIQWTSKGGSGQSTSSMADLAVFSDGRVKVGPRFAKGKAAEHTLTDAEFKALYRFVFVEQDIWSIDAAELEREVKTVSSLDTEVGSHVEETVPLGAEVIADAATSVIYVREGEREHEVSLYNLFSRANRHPEINALKRLRAIELRLLELAQWVASTAR